MAAGRRSGRITLVLGLACLAAGALSPAAAAGRDLVDHRVLQTGFERIDDLYLDPVDMERLTLDGLKGLSRLEPRLAFARAGGVLRAELAGLPAGEFALPVGNRAAEWAGFAARVAEALRGNSPALEKAGPEALYEAMFDALVADLDPNSRYTSAAQAEDERSMREGYVGIGITVKQSGRHTWIVDVLPDGPADRAGIRPGEALLAVEGSAMEGMSSERVVSRLSGRIGTTVTVAVGNPGQAPRRMTLRRDRVVPRTVTAAADGALGVLRIERFNASTVVNLADGIKRLREQLGPGAAGWVLDLRGNPGGLLDQAVAVADRFVASGRIVSTEGRHPDSLQRYDARPDDLLEGAPLVVLIDGRSASAAEVVAAALQDSGRAVVVGASSYGKGSVQTVTRLPNQGELFLTWSRIHAPSGYTLHRQGVQPTVCTSRGIEAPEQALEELRQGSAVPASTLAMWRDRALTDEAALARLREACPWKEHAPGLDLEVARALLADPALYRRALAQGQRDVAQR
ncbi:MAG TPA: S41 family peptidase [Azospirillaceae bacterium]|nr:S41 family peptidase [Azospirillaceae bacterium]